MDTGLLISTVIITLASFTIGLFVGLRVARKQFELIEKMSEMHAGTLASVIWMLNGYEEGDDDDEEPEEKPPAVVLAFAQKETEDDE
jgi:hypothetical protein